MADIRPFRGLMYDPVLDLNAVTAPPYDVINAEQAARLRMRSPYNAVHADLPVSPGQQPSAAAYERAATTLAGWRRDGALRRGAEPSLYLVDQIYRGPDGRERTRRGFVARLALADYGERVVLPHERTHATAKVDRLELYRAAHADVSQIFLLFPDDDGAIGAELAAAADEVMGAAREARDGDGNRHLVAPFSGARAERVVALLHDRRLYIADGHHRYETALAYRDERRSAGDYSADTMMVYLCAMDDPGLAVFPTHRLVRGVDVPSQTELLARLAPDFEVRGEPIGGRAACASAFERLADEDDPGRVFGLYFPRDDSGVVVHLRDKAPLDRLVARGFSPVAAGLSVTVLHEIILREALGIDPATGEKHVAYAKSVPETFAALEGGEFGLAAFVNATLVSEVRAIADLGETMPQKSTFFYPKLLTGLVFDDLNA